MLFNSLPFLVFFPAFLLVYSLTRDRVRLWVCLLGSYYFYASWDWRFLALIWVSTGIDYAVGRALGTCSAPRRRRGLLITSLVVNLGLLGIFKYYDFFAVSAAALLRRIGFEVDPFLLGVALPVGISFYTFQTLSYTIDVYRERIPAERSLLRFATFVALFPQLVAGPIVRAGWLLPQLRADRQVGRRNLLIGIQCIVWGYFLKTVVADNLAPVVDERFAYPELHGGLSLALGVLAFGFQIYGDFAGYSSIAIGLGRILGFDFGINFDRPYLSASFSEFWRRWHISLSTWLRDYLYIPLGGNRRGSARTLGNLMLTMLLGGLWHGANWTFLVWGALHGSYLVLERVLSPVLGAWVRVVRLPSWAVRTISLLVVFVLTQLSWIFFRASTLTEAVQILRSVVTLAPSPSPMRDYGEVVGAMTLIGVLLMIELVGLRVDYRRKALEHPVVFLVVVGLGIATILLFGQFSGKAFIYFQF